MLLENAIKNTVWNFKVPPNDHWYSGGFYKLKKVEKPCSSQKGENLGQRCLCRSRISKRSSNKVSLNFRSSKTHSKSQFHKFHLNVLSPFTHFVLIVRHNIIWQNSAQICLLAQKLQPFSNYWCEQNDLPPCHQYACDFAHCVNLLKKLSQG